MDASSLGTASEPGNVTPIPQNTSSGSAPDMSLLALNATGELKYLGPSSGTFYASYAKALARSSASEPNSWRRSYPAGPHDATVVGRPEEAPALTPERAQFLLKSYQMWVDPIYPLLDPEYLERLVDSCGSGSTAEAEEMAVFYFVMALGATNCVSTRRQMQAENTDGRMKYSPSFAPSPSYLYSKGLQCIDDNVHFLKPSLAAIQIILLICIYSSYGPVGSSQWQLSGLAMRMAIEIGLHYAPEGSQMVDGDLSQRSRVFWSAYAIEISLAYNLGRPPSIGDEHITASIIGQGNKTSLGIHHIKHRQIQSRIVSQVYCGHKASVGLSEEERQIVLSGLQAELDEWRSLLPTIYHSDTVSRYPLSYWERLYHGTSFVLHRSSPLCPQPSVQSLERSIRSAGEYLTCMTDTLRNSNVSLSWMLVQGVLFAGLTMLVTVRTNIRTLAAQVGLPFLLVDIPSWIRQCTICLTITNERWSEDLLARLDTEFEVLASDTIKLISTSISSQQLSETSHQMSNPPSNSNENRRDVPLDTIWHDDILGMTQESVLTDRPDDDWGNLPLFRQFLGIDDGVQTFWDIGSMDLDNSSWAT
ncbi:fungal-specific transcription factor domain-containing protein [Mariannaea sp. PMI_226]|nr:fungal-specific transcription factor domain-containing protein [Mariannaea sp. PMI_226]